MKIFSFALLFFFCISSAAQVSNTLPWTWMSGTNTTNSYGVYGMMGTPSTTNYPGGREGGGTQWTDTSGNLWLFGGWGLPASGSQGFMNDLWKYDPVANEWTWMGGANTTNIGGSYGTKGVAAATNQPGSRYLAAAWTDNSGNLWLFGGYGYDKNTAFGALNDLWKYNIATGWWTWMNGDDTYGNAGVYGSLGVSSPTNKPGSRNRFNETNGKIDASGYLWMFGGAGYGSTTTYGCLNDLWKYNTNTNEWTWVSGDNTINNAGVYGTMGTAAASNKPGARDGGSCWLDTAGKFWLFGGGYSPTGFWDDKYSDLWKFDPVTGFWTWMKGDNSINQFGSYGTMGVANASNKPGGRLMNANWLDNYGNFWLFGGYGWAETGTGSTGNQGLNDLWKYSPTTNEWTWMGGSNSPSAASVYGTMGVAAPTNIPGNRSGDYRWIDKYGNLWKFAGLSWDAPTVFRNDLWKLVIPQPVAKGNLVSCQTLPTVTIDASNNNTWVPLYDSIGNIAIEILGNGNSLGTVSTSLFTKTGQCREDGNYKMYINRNLMISTQNQPSSNVSVRFYILDAELDSLRLNFNSQGQQTGAATINEVDVFKNNDTCSTVGSQTALPLTATNGSYYSDAYLQVDVSSFSSFYFSNKTFTFLLPVKIKSFTGNRAGAVNILKWDADCSAAVNFTIERSLDNRQFVPVGSVAASVQDCNHSFFFTDTSPGDDKNYYRLKAVAPDGSIIYSSIILLQADKGPSLQIGLTSTFTSISTTVLISSMSSSTIDLCINDINGRLVLYKRVYVQSGSNSVQLNTAGFTAGIYFLYATNSDGRSNVVRLLKE